MTIQQRFQQANGILEKADLLFDEATCRAALERMAEEITADLAGQYPLLLPVMGGAVVFTGQLLPLLRFPLDFDYVHVSRYGSERGGSVQLNWLRAPQNSVEGRHVLVLDDILDEGHTMVAMHKHVREMGAAPNRLLPIMWASTCPTAMCSATAWTPAACGATSAPSTPWLINNEA